MKHLRKRAAGVTEARLSGERGGADDRWAELLRILDSPGREPEGPGDRRVVGVGEVDGVILPAPHAFHREYAEHFIEQRGATRMQIDHTFARLTYTTDLAATVRDADLISESVPEVHAIKESF